GTGPLRATDTPWRVHDRHRRSLGARSRSHSVTGLVDTHAHLMDPAFANDLDSVFARGQAAGVAAIVLVGYDLASSRAAVDLARKLPATCAAVGIHPNSAA